MIKDYWVWQNRNVDVPWALYIVKNYRKPQTIDTTILDVTIYSEDIDNDSHAMNVLGRQYDTISEYVDEIEHYISKFSNFKQEDYKQVETAIFKIMMDE